MYSRQVSQKRCRRVDCKSRRVAIAAVSHLRRFPLPPLPVRVASGRALSAQQDAQKVAPEELPEAFVAAQDHLKSVVEICRGCSLCSKSKSLL